jgi:hypothetical protein
MYAAASRVATRAVDRATDALPLEEVLADTLRPDVLRWAQRSFAFGHVLRGEVIRGGPAGLHHVPGPGNMGPFSVRRLSSMRSREATMQPPPPDQTWLARVEMQRGHGNAQATKFSTMFPTRWSAAHVVEAVYQVAQSMPISNARRGAEWITHDGVANGIGIRLRADAATGYVHTAYPQSPGQADRLFTRQR